MFSSSAQRAGRARTGEIFFVKAAGLHRHGQRVAEHQGIDGTGGRREVHRTGFTLYGNIKHRFSRQRQRRSGLPVIASGGMDFPQARDDKIQPLALPE